MGCRTRCADVGRLYILYLILEFLNGFISFNIGSKLENVPNLNLDPVVQKVDNAIHRINHYPLDSAIDFHNTYPLNSDLFGG